MYLATNFKFELRCGSVKLIYTDLHGDSLLCLNCFVHSKNWGIKHEPYIIISLAVACKCIVQSSFIALLVFQNFTMQPCQYRPNIWFCNLKPNQPPSFDYLYLISSLAYCFPLFICLEVLIVRLPLVLMVLSKFSLLIK